jgi:nucleoid-associated protein YgaU
MQHELAECIQIMLINASPSLLMSQMLDEARAAAAAKKARKGKKRAKKSKTEDKRDAKGGKEKAKAKKTPVVIELPRHLQQIAAVHAAHAFGCPTADSIACTMQQESWSSFLTDMDDRISKQKVRGV